MSLTGNAQGNTLRGKINRLYELRGYSAYEVAVINGFSGTEEDWLNSLNGTANLEDETAGTKYALVVTNGKLYMKERT